MQLTQAGLPTAYIQSFQNTLTGGIDPNDTVTMANVLDLSFPTMSHAVELAGADTDTDTTIAAVFSLVLPTS